MTTSLPSGLRERKKAKTRAAIRDHAMRLFEEQGFAATTVDQIVAAAEVSQSTFFRYFPTKEDVLLTDDFDAMVAEAIRVQPPDTHPIEAIRVAIHSTFESVSDEDWQRERRRQRLFTSVPEVRGRAMQQYLDTIDLLAGLIAGRAGLPADDYSARVLAGAVVGALIAGMPDRSGMEVERGDTAWIDRALGLLRAGLPLGPGEARA